MLSTSHKKSNKWLTQSEFWRRKRACCSISAMPRRRERMPCELFKIPRQPVQFSCHRRQSKGGAGSLPAVKTVALKCLNDLNFSGGIECRDSKRKSENEGSFHGQFVSRRLTELLVEKTFAPEKRTAVRMVRESKMRRNSELFRRSQLNPAALVCSEPIAGAQGACDPPVKRNTLYDSQLSQARSSLHKGCPPRFNFRSET